MIQGQIEADIRAKAKLRPLPDTQTVTRKHGPRVDTKTKFDTHVVVTDMDAEGNGRYTLHSKMHLQDLKDASETASKMISDQVNDVVHDLGYTPVYETKDGRQWVISEESLHDLVAFYERRQASVHPFERKPGVTSTAGSMIKVPDVRARETDLSRAHAEDLGPHVEHFYGKDVAEQLGIDEIKFVKPRVQAVNSEEMWNLGVIGNEVGTFRTVNKPRKTTGVEFSVPVEDAKWTEAGD